MPRHDRPTDALLAHLRLAPEAPTLDYLHRLVAAHQRHAPGKIPARCHLHPANKPTTSSPDAERAWSMRWWLRAVVRFRCAA